MSSAYTMSRALAWSARIFASTAAMTGASVVWNMRIDMAQPCGVPRDCFRNGERRLLTFQAKVFRRQFSKTMLAKCSETREGVGEVELADKGGGALVSEGPKVREEVGIRIGSHIPVESASCAHAAALKPPFPLSRTSGYRGTKLCCGASGGARTWGANRAKATMR
eukprot:5678995-Amphidinium_carterae.1